MIPPLLPSSHLNSEEEVKLQITFKHIFTLITILRTQRHSLSHLWKVQIL